jgi:hypothetical protein
MYNLCVCFKSSAKFIHQHAIQLSQLNIVLFLPSDIFGRFRGICASQVPIKTQPIQKKHAQDEEDDDDVDPQVINFISQLPLVEISYKRR